jgi:alcohol dehydrogenase class IV
MSTAPPTDQTPWWSFATAGRVSFGPECSRFLPQAVQELGDRVVLCTDANLVAAGVIEPMMSALRRVPGLDVLVFDEGQAEIGFEGAESCAAQLIEFAPNVVVGVGGGSNMDLAKVVSARVGDPRPISSWSTQGVPSTALPVVAIPTTAGTGSEVTAIAVLTDEANQTKVGFQSRALLPRAVFVDPLLTMSCPAKVTAYSGMDALTHAIECFTAIGFEEKAVQGYADQLFVGKNPLSDALAKDAISFIGRSLITAVRSGDDLGARTDMALGSLLAGMAFSSGGTAIVHALQYPLGALTKTAHGHGNAVLLPSAVRFNLSVRQREAALVARLLGSSTPSDADAAAELPEILENLAIAVGITPSLRSLGVNDQDLASMASSAGRITRLVSNNPRPVDDHALLEVLRGALDYAPLSDGSVVR